MLRFAEDHLLEALARGNRIMRTSSYAPALLAGLLILLIFSAYCGGSAWGEEPASVSEADLTYFYRAPNSARVTRLITYFDQLRAAEKPGVRPPLMGFFAAAFQRYPADIDQMIPESVSPQMMGLLAISLRLAGQQARAESLIERLESRDAVVPDLTTVPTSLEAVEAVGPNEFDLLWGASFATGDPHYCSKILRRIAGTANIGDNADDLVHLVRNREIGSDQRWIVEKRGNERARELIIVATALWALHANAQQHSFVQAMTNEYVTAHPTEPAAKALLALAHEYGHYRLGKLVSVGTDPGTHSVSIDVVSLSQILDDLGRHAGSYPPHFEFEDDRKRAEKDVTTISNLLDPLTDNFSENPPMLLRLAILHVIGFNLDIPDSLPKAVSTFDKLLRLTPNDPQANFRYGSFLAASTKDGRAIPFLEKARSLGVEGADYWLGLSYAVTGKKAKAIDTLERYTRRVPTDERAIAMLEAIRNNRFNVEVKKQ
jgi:tetratricopeptide (TPR) repeat protein